MIFNGIEVVQLALSIGQLAMGCVEPAQQQLVVMLAPHGDGKVHTSHPDSRVKFVLLNREALGEPDVQTCIHSYDRQRALPLGSMCEDHGSFGSGNEILGVALIEPFALHNALLPLSRDQMILWARGVSICKGSSPSAIFFGQNPLGLPYRNLSTLSTFTVDDFFFHFID